MNMDLLPSLTNYFPGCFIPWAFTPLLVSVLSPGEQPGESLHSPVKNCTGLKGTGPADFQSELIWGLLPMGVLKAGALDVESNPFAPRGEGGRWELLQAYGPGPKARGSRLSSQIRSGHVPIYLKNRHPSASLCTCFKGTAPVAVSLVCLRKERELGVSNVPACASPALWSFSNPLLCWALGNLLCWGIRKHLPLCRPWSYFLHILIFSSLPWC